MKRLVAIVGPTGVGKSRLALRLAGLFSGEIIGADSRQVYRHLDIGTAKPSPEERSLVPHHLVDIIDPDAEFSLALYQKLAVGAIADIHRRVKIPFLVGGTGLYIKAVLEGWKIPAVSPDTQFRYNIEKRASEGGAGELYEELARLDPEAARKIDRRNIRRVVRALEVSSRAGGPFSRLVRKEPPDFASFVIGLTADRAALYEIVDCRVDEMMARGLVREVEKIRDMRYDFGLPSLSGIGYRQVALYLKGEMTLADAVRKIKTETHRFIRHQYAWFRPVDETIHWFDVRRPDFFEEMERALAGFLNNK
jgi:tRNA dimethylallyltransferase